MQIELIAFWSFICILLIVFAELRADFRMLGVIGCILLVPLAFGIIVTGVEYQVGVTETVVETIQQNIPINLSSSAFVPVYKLESKELWLS